MRGTYRNIRLPLNGPLKAALGHGAVSKVKKIITTERTKKAQSSQRTVNPLFKAPCSLCLLSGLCG